MANTPDLSAPIREAIVGASAITDLLPDYVGDYPVFTRKPVPEDAPFPQIVASDLTITDEDGVNFAMPVLTWDVSVFGKNDTPANYRKVRTIAGLLRDLFQRPARNLIVPDWGLVDVMCHGPMPAPDDDLTIVGRSLTMTIRLAAGS